MQRKKNYFSISVYGCMFLLLMMCWLCVCTPFQYQVMQRQASHSSGNTRQDPPDEDNNQQPEDLCKKNAVPFNEEYLHPFSINSGRNLILTAYKEFAVSIHQLYHGELFCPPPNFS